MEILLVEDDGHRAAALATSLRESGHGVAIVATVRDALRLIDAGTVDAIVLERLLPDVDGITALRWLRGGRVTLPIVLVSADQLVDDVVAGLEAGADDYLVRPFDPVELEARLRALLRGRRWATWRPDTLRLGSVTVSPSRGRAWVDETPLRLSELEFKLLTQLLSHAGAVMTRAMLVETVWGYDAMPDTNIVDVHVSKLRRKLIAQTGGDPIVTVRGAGYMIDG